MGHHPKKYRKHIISGDSGNKKDRKTIIGAQVRAARALLDISADTLAVMAGLGIVTIRRAEKHNGLTPLSQKTTEKIVQAFKIEGVEFIDAEPSGEGVRFLKSAAVTDYGRSSG